MFLKLFKGCSSCAKLLLVDERTKVLEEKNETFLRMKKVREIALTQGESKLQSDFLRRSSLTINYAERKLCKLIFTKLQQNEIYLVTRAHFPTPQLLLQYQKSRFGYVRAFLKVNTNIFHLGVDHK